MTQTDPPLPLQPDQVGGGLQPERTTLAWERTGIALVVAGVLLGRHAARDLHPLVGVVGVIQVLGGGAVLGWALRNHDDLHDPGTRLQDVVQVGMTRLVGLGTVVFTSAALLAGVASLF